MSKARLARITSYRTLTSYDIAYATGNYTHCCMVYFGGRYAGLTRLNWGGIKKCYQLLKRH
jgi:hypothetical protein